jgi:hypothetical protein
MTARKDLSKILVALVVLVVAFVFTAPQLDASYAASKATKTVKVDKYLKSIKTSNGTIVKTGKNTFTVTLPTDKSSAKLTFAKTAKKDKARTKVGAAKWGKWSGKSVSAAAKNIKVGQTVTVKATVKRGKQIATYTVKVYRPAAPTEEVPENEVITPEPAPSQPDPPPVNTPTPPVTPPENSTTPDPPVTPEPPTENPPITEPDPGTPSEPPATTPDPNEGKYHLTMIGGTANGVTSGWFAYGEELYIIMDPSIQYNDKGGLRNVRWKIEYEAPPGWIVGDADFEMGLIGVSYITTYMPNWNVTLTAIDQ